MKLADVPADSKFLDVDGIAVVLLPTGRCIAFVDGAGTEVDSRTYPNAQKAGMDGDRLSRKEFAAWLSTGFARFDVRR